ncbi:arginase [Paenibacillus sp. 481]|uniref:arginase n=1 Tax=Paenibacillus sp. 481 TaxID=2835869 RepID=UPI001E46F7E1|nr:arginase [Paenibacillus sp. 481]UHA75736.1 arginase [Paenibacillus sp. 481]
MALIRVPFGLGAGNPGAEFGPDSIVHAGLMDRLEQLGLEVSEEQSIMPVTRTSDCHPSRTNLAIKPKAKHLQDVLQMSTALADHVDGAVTHGHFPLVLGGDHSIAIGTLAGLVRHYDNLGVIWFDAHSDLNTEDTSPTGNVHGMSLAVALGIAGLNWPHLQWSGPRIKPEHVVLIGCRDLDQGEKAFIREQGITCFTMHEIDRMGIERVVMEALKIVGKGTDGVHLSFDIDSLDPLEAPGTGTAVAGGVSYREAHFALEMMHESGLITSAEFVEVNPTLDVKGKTAKLAVELIGSLLGERIL